NLVQTIHSLSRAGVDLLARRQQRALGAQSGGVYGVHADVGAIGGVYDRTEMLLHVRRYGDAFREEEHSLASWQAAHRIDNRHHPVRRGIALLLTLQSLESLLGPRPHRLESLLNRGGPGRSACAHRPSAARLRGPSRRLNGGLALRGG